MTEQQESTRSTSLLRRLLDARVIQTLAIYIPVGWVLTEIAAAATENFGLPSWVSGGAMVLLIAGIPVVAFLAWVFQITDDGIQTEVASLKGGLAITIALTLLLGLGAVLFQNLETDPDLIVDRDLGNAHTPTVATVAVMPFVDDNPDSKLGRTFTIELTERLSRHADLFVVAPGSTFSPQLASIGPTLRAEVLNADHIVMGTISKDGDSNVLSIRLENDQQKLLWEDELRFGDDIESQQGLQRRVSQRLAELLGTKTRSAEYCEPTNNIEALEAYHQARLNINQKGPEKLKQAEQLLKKAITLDPDYGRAYSALAITILLQRKPGAGSLAVDLSRKALNRCPTLGAAYKIWVPSYEGVSNDLIDQELQFLDSLAMEPNHLWILDNYAQRLVGWGRFDEALKIIERSYRNNPLQARAIVTYAWANLDDNPDFSIRLADKAEELGDQSCNVQMLRVVAAWLSSDSIDVYRQAYDEIPQRCKEAMTQGWEEVGIDTFFEAMRDPKKRRIVLDSGRAHIYERPNQAMVWGIEFSDPDLAFDAIDIALEQQSYIHYEQFWLQEDGGLMFRRDPRFVELANRLGLVEYWQEFGWPSGGTCTPFGDSFICDK